MRKFISKPVTISVIEYQSGVSISGVLERPDRSAYVQSAAGNVLLNEGDFVVVESTGPDVQRVYSAAELAASFDEVKTPVHRVKEAVVESKPVEKIAVMETKPVKKVTVKKAAVVTSKPVKEVTAKKTAAKKPK